MLKKYIDEYRIEDVPRNGIITIEETNEEGNKIKVKKGISNIPSKFEKEPETAKLNGYYEYVENEIPEYNAETHYLTSKYAFDGEQIIKVWIIKEIPVDEVME